MDYSTSTLNTPFNKMGYINKMIVFKVLIIVMLLVCVSLVYWTERGRPIFLDVFGVTDLSITSMCLM
jgi:hypothetical protein